MPATLDFWFDFASTYSYPAAVRIGALAARADVRVRFRPLLLGPIFTAQGWTTSPFNLYPEKGRYMWRDLERLCADLDVPFHRPDPFPQNSLLAARVALVALDQGWGEAFCVALFRAQFGEARRIDDEGVLDDVLATLQIDPSPVLAAARSDANKTRLRAQTEEAQRLGLFGAPSFTTVDGELFWGNDRLEAALRWARGQCADNDRE
jgi:2-hydroxychromene-2-carboxylate isomerase